MRTIHLCLAAFLTTLPVGCGKKEVAAPPPVEQPKPADPNALKPNEVAGVLVSVDIKTGEITAKVDGVDRKWWPSSKQRIKYSDGTEKGSPNAVPFTMNDVILVTEKQGEKEFVVEIRFPPRRAGPGDAGNKVVGKFKFDPQKPQKLTLTVDGADRELEPAPYVRLYASTGQQVNHLGPRYFQGMTVTAVVEPRDGKEVVTEIWEAKPEAKQ